MDSIHRSDPPKHESLNDRMSCGCREHGGRIIYTGTREATILNLRHKHGEGVNLDQFTISTAEGERLNVDDYMVRYAP